MRNTLLFAAGSFLLVAGAVMIASLHGTNAKLRVEIQDKRLQHEDRIGLAANPAELRSPVVGLVEEPAGANAEMKSRVRQLDAEISRLEKKAADDFLLSADGTDAPPANRDPEKGMTKLEYLQDVGQATPSRALQTYFWAALKGDEEAMGRVFGWDESLRPKVRALIDRLPDNLRTRYSTPEKLSALLTAKYALDVSAIHITGTVMKDGTNAVLTVKGLTGKDEHLPMRLGPAGWQLWSSEGALKSLDDALSGGKDP